MSDRTREDIGLSRLGRFAALLALATAVALVVAAPAGAKAVSGEQTLIDQEAGTYKMTGSLIGDWAITSFTEIATEPVYRAEGTEKFKGCLDRDGDGACRGEPNGKAAVQLPLLGELRRTMARWSWERARTPSPTARETSERRRGSLCSWTRRRPPPRSSSRPSTRGSSTSSTVARRGRGAPRARPRPAEDLSACREPGRGRVPALAYLVITTPELWTLKSSVEFG